MQSFLGDWRAKQIHVGGVKEGTQSRHESGGVSVNIKLTASVHGEWGREQSVVYRPVYYHFNFLFVGEVDELHMYGGVIRASFGLGRIRKLVLHHKVDTGDQSGGGAGITFPLSPSAVSSGVMDNIKSLSVSISMGGMVRLNGGRCVFDVPGIKVDDWIDLDMPAVQYDTRTTITATVNNTTLGDAAPTGTTAIGSIGMQVGDVPVHMDVPSGIVPGHEGRTHAWHDHRYAQLEAKALRAQRLTADEQKELDSYRREIEAQRAAEAAERAARQQAEVDRRKAEAKQLVEEGIAKEKAEEKRKELLRSKQRVGTLTLDERDELQDMLDRDAAQRAAQPAAAAAAAASAPQHVDPLGDINTNNLTPSDRQKIQEMSDRYIGLPGEKAAKVEQAQQMLAYLKSQLPTDKADQAFRVLAEKGIFNQVLLASAGSLAGLGAGVGITLEVVGGIVLAPEIVMGALIAGGVYVTYEIATYLIDKIRSTSGDAAARDAEDTFERRRHEGDRSRSAAVPRAGSQSAAAGGNPDPDDDLTKCPTEPFNPKAKENYTTSKNHRSFGKFVKGKDGFWYTRDLAGHGDSAWKRYVEKASGLEHDADLDKCGKIIPKHKGPKGKNIPWKELS
ncbi:hypothetical protein [Candidatus Bodocaedibacter vickermanii]